MGTFESGKDTKDTKEFDGMLPLESVLKANSGLNTIYGSPAMVEASRLMIVGQTVSGESFKNYTKQLVEKDPSLADVLSNNVLGVRLNEDRTHSIVVVSPNGKLISAIDDEALTNIKTLTDLIKNLDKKLKQ